MFGIFWCASIVFHCFESFCGPGGIPMDSERNFDSYGGPETPNRPFSIHFNSFLDIFWISGPVNSNSFRKSRPQTPLSRQSPMWKMIAYWSSSYELFIRIWTFCLSPGLRGMCFFRKALFHFKLIFVTLRTFLRLDLFFLETEIPRVPGELGVLTKPGC